MIDATEVSLELCYPSEDARAVDAKSVKELAASIAEVGLLNPISVRKAIRVRAGRDADVFEVLAGMHRVKAFRHLGREAIPAYIFEADDLRASLILIDENLCRKDLSPAERANQVAKRKRIYEALYPETSHGAVGRAGKSRKIYDSSMEADEEARERFTKATAAKTGRSESSVQKEAHRGEALGEQALAKVAGTSLDKGEELDALAALTPERRTALIDRAAAGEKVSAKVEAKKERRESRERDLGDKQRALPAKRYGVILADPEWRFEVRSRVTGLDRAADNHYPTSDLEAIKVRPVAGIAADDCVLFLWATAPMLPQALEVMAAWGFAYKSHIVWRKAEKYAAKPVLGTGYWFRNGHEMLLVGTRGSVVAPAMGTQWASIADAAPRKHSAKPDWQYELVETYFPNLPKIELNARRARAGWDTWGLEAPPPLPPHDPETGEIIEGIYPEGRSGTAREAPSTGSGTTAATPIVGVQPAAPHTHPIGSDSAGKVSEQGLIPADEAAGAIPVAPAADIDIPAFLRAGAPEDAWANRGEAA